MGISRGIKIKNRGKSPHPRTTCNKSITEKKYTKNIYTQKNYPIKVAVCVIAKWEEQYLVEWVEHYKNMGFDNILFYDNNETGDSSQYDILSSYINNKYVKYHDIRGRCGGTIQKKCYRNCLNTYKTEYDWIAFFDADEFLDLGEYKNIYNFLKSSEKFSDYDGIVIEWETYGDNGLVKYDNRPLSERFTNVIENIQPCVKTIINVHNIEHKKIISVHTISAKKMCDCKGNEITIIKGNRIRKKYVVNVKLKHYKYKTIEEFLKKIDRGDINKRNGRRLEKKEKYNERLRYFIKDFFRVNDITLDKLQEIKAIFPSYNIERYFKKIKSIKKE